MKLALANRPQRKVIHHYLPIHRHYYTDHIVQSSNDDYEEPNPPSMLERQSYGGGGGGYEEGCCDASYFNLSAIIRALLLAILVPLALLFSFTLLFLLATTLKNYAACLLGFNVTVNGVVYNCTGISGFGSFGGSVNIIR